MIRQQKTSLYTLSDLLAVIGIPLLIFWYISNGNENVFLYDDNHAQWLPVINNAFRSLLETGKLNFFDMHIMNGENLLDTGIYSLLNPIMLLAYATSAALKVSNTITVYIFFVSVLSALFYQCAMKKMEIDRSARYLLLFCLFGTGAFYTFGYWYYIFNNLLWGALMLWGIVSVKGRSRYVYWGILLGFSIYLGNIQYSVLWYTVYGMISLTNFFLASDKGHRYCQAKEFMTNMTMGLLLNFPQIVLCLRALRSSQAFEAHNSAFYADTLSPTNIFWYGILPEQLFNFLGIKDFLTPPWFGNRYFFCGVLMISFIVGWWMIHDNKNNRREVILPFWISAFVMILYTCGRGFLIADILYHFPIFNGFRHLHKAYFVLIPILFIMTIFIYAGTQWPWKRIVIIAGAFLALINISSINICGNETGGGQFTNRTLTLIECPNNDTYVGFNNDMEKILIRNWPCYFHVYTLGGYNLSFNHAGYEVCDQIFTEAQHFSEYSYANAVNLTYWLERVKDGVIDLGKWEEQLKYNAVQHLIVKYNNENVFCEFVNIFDQLEEIKIIDIIESEEQIKIIKLGGTYSLVSDETGKPLHIEDIPNGIIITGNTKEISGTVNTQFLWNAKYKAYGASGDLLDIERDDRGYLRIRNSMPNEKIILHYEDSISTLAIIFSVVSTIGITTVIIVNSHSRRQLHGGNT